MSSHASHASCMNHININVHGNISHMNDKYSDKCNENDINNNDDNDNDQDMVGYVINRSPTVEVSKSGSQTNCNTVHINEEQAAASFKPCGHSKSLLLPQGSRRNLDSKGSSRQYKKSRSKTRGTGVVQKDINKEKQHRMQIQIGIQNIKLL